MKHSNLFIVYIVLNVILRAGCADTPDKVAQQQETSTLKAIVDDVFAISVSNPCQYGHIRFGTSCIRLHGSSDY